MRIIIDVSGKGSEASVHAFVQQAYGGNLYELQLPPGMADRQLVLRHVDQLLQRMGMNSSETPAEQSAPATSKVVVTGSWPDAVNAPDGETA